MMYYDICNNKNCKLKTVTFTLSNGLCNTCNALRHHEGYGHIKIEYINHCKGGCNEPINVNHDMCWSCKHDYLGECEDCFGHR